MNAVPVLVLCVIFAAVALARPEQEKYDTSQYDSFDIDALLPNDRARRGYINCLKTGTKCTAEGQQLRDILPDAIQTGCSRCTELQKSQAKKILDYTLKNHPEEYNELVAHFDPSGNYRREHAEVLKKEGVVLPN